MPCGAWMTMVHGQADLIYDDQGGPRGATQGFSTSMLMFMARRELGDGALGLRVMASTDPLMGRNGYPLLFQTGETANGRDPLIDRQHPHDLLMEAAATYSLNLSPRGSLFVYAGLAGAPALGPNAGAAARPPVTTRRWRGGGKRRSRGGGTLRRP